MRDNESDMNKKQFADMAMYVDQLEPIIMKNEARAMQEENNKELTQGGGRMPQGDVVAEEGAAELLDEPTQLSDSIAPQL